MKIDGEKTTRGYQEHLLFCIRKICNQNGGICTYTTKMLAEASGATRNITKKALQDLVARNLLRREMDREEGTRYVLERRLYPIKGIHANPS